MRMTLIRKERTSDAAAIREINEAAFGGSEEADIVDTLRENCEDYFSLVALSDDELVGHILFSPVLLEPREQPQLKGMGLGPMAVRPEYQRQGFGSRMVEKGLELLEQGGCPFIVVLGHPEYYPRFGFERASAHGIAPEFPDVPDEAFMIKHFATNVTRLDPGTATYRREFSAAAR
jgi:putative acetyltransferase